MATITGDGGDNNLVDTPGSDTIDAQGGNDTITVTNGNDTVSGGSGTDTLIIDYSGSLAGLSNPFGPTGDLVNGYSGAISGDGSHRVDYSGIEKFVITGSNVADNVATGGFDDQFNLNDGDDFASAGTGGVIADGGAGIDGLGADLSALTNGLNINLQANSSSGDASVSITNFEYLGNGSFAFITGSGNDVIVTGTDNKADFINTGGGSDAVTVVNGNDTITGGSGTDTLIIDYSGSSTGLSAPFGPTGDLVNGYSGAISGDGSHRVDYFGIEKFVITGSAVADNLTTGDFDDIIRTGTGNDTVNAAGGNDRVEGGDGNDILDGGIGDDIASYASAGAGVTVSLAAQGGSQDTVGAGTDTLSNFENLAGSAFADNLTGDGGDNGIDGGAGADAMAGGAGNDIYIVDNSGDTISELAGEGSRDFVFAQTSYVLQTNVFVEVLRAYDPSGTAPMSLTGNSSGQEIYGNAGANSLVGGTGRDVLAGLGGDDVLSGGAGAANELIGGDGNDTYIVSTAGDSIFEQAGGGTDTVQTALSFYWMKAANVENLVGASLSAQTLVGNAGDNHLTGGAGNDELVGGVGNDTYVILNAGDTIVEQGGEGTDTIETALNYYFMDAPNVENLTFTGGGDFYGHGNAGGNFITGGAGNDLLDGGLGADTLIGNAGADSFLFDSALGGGNVDAISGFVSGSDRVLLDNSIFTQLGEGGLAPSAFVVGTAAGDADDRIIYDSATGNLYYDADGSGAGAAVQFATLSGHPALTANDFAVI